MMRPGKLPDVGTTIFTVISQLAGELGAVNLGQGFPDYPVDPALIGLIGDAMRAGHNQYAPMAGVPALQDAIAAGLRERQGVTVDPRREVTITLGATEAIFSALLALLGPGDEAIVFDPSYDSYDPAIRLAGAACVRVPMTPPQFAYDWDRVAASITPRTRMILINSPQNPSCTVIGADDLDHLAALAQRHDLLVLSDEVYEPLVYDGRRHHGVLAHPGLAARSVVVFSFGKVLHATGLRIGYAVAPPALTGELRKVHQFNTFTVPTAFQHAIAAHLAATPDSHTGLAAFFAPRRDILPRLLADTPLRFLPAAGTYFQLADYSACPGLGALDDLTAATTLLREAGVASIPLSPFYRDPPGSRLLRFCFAKREETLVEGARRLREYVTRA
jgi:methionine aminotransferase